MLLTSIFLLLFSNSLNLRRDISIYYSRIGIIILAYCIFFSYNNLFISYLNLSIGLYDGLFSLSSIDIIFDIFLFFITSLILNLTGFYPRKFITNSYFNLFSISYKLKLNLSNLINNKSEHYTIIEYTLILLFIIMGSVLLISSNDLVSVYLSIELQSYGLYILCTLYRNSESSTSSGLTYFLLGGLSSCFILLGIGLIYANTGTTSLDNFYIITNLSNIVKDNGIQSFLYKDIAIYLPYYLLILTIGFLFKISAAPFHFWSPDVYDKIPTIVTTFVAIIPKISIFILLLHLVHFSNNIYITNQYSWTSSLLISSLLSLIIGTVLGLTQFRIKRLFAYSTISHVGFLLLALSINSIESIQSFIFYLIQYSITNLNAFFLLISIGYTLFFYINNSDKHRNLLEKNNSPIQLISQLKGYFYINYMLAISLSITLLSFAGIPPLVGFFAKQMVLSAALQNGFIFLALIGIITSVISAVYYLNIIKIMFFYNHPYIYKRKFNNIQVPAEILKNNKVVNNFYIKSNLTISNSITIPISILTLFILLFIFMPDQWLNISNLLSFILFTPYVI